METPSCRTLLLMETPSCRTLLLLMTAAISVSSRADAVFMLEARLVNYTNPSHTLGQPARCCDSQDPPHMCTSKCDNKFTLCLRNPLHSNTTRNVGGSCDLGMFSTQPDNDDDIQFSTGSSAIQLSRSTSTSNPLLYLGSNWPGVVQFVIEVVDADDPSGPTNDDYIDTIFIDLTYLAPSTTFTPVTQHTGIVGHSTIGMAFRLSCVPNHYGPTCSVFCEPRNDSRGHYSCDSQGGIVCNHGYTNESTGCVQCVPAPSCSLVGGFCTVPGGCTCSPGYRGSHCEVDLDPCGHASPCMNGGDCYNTTPGHYSCSCPSMYSGDHCQYREEGTQLVAILASSLGVGVAIITMVMIFVLCITLRGRRLDKATCKKMRSMDVPLPPPTHTIELQKNPGYGLLCVQSDSRIPPMCVGGEPHTLTHSLDTPSDPNDYEGYVNEGLGPRDTPTVSVEVPTARRARHNSDPLHGCRTDPRPELDDRDHPIPDTRQNSTAQLIVLHS